MIKINFNLAAENDVLIYVVTQLHRHVFRYAEELLSRVTFADGLRSI